MGGPVIGPAHVAVSTGQLWGLGKGLSSPPPPIASSLPNQPTCQPGGSKEPGLKHTHPLGSRNRHQLLPPAAAPATRL